MSFSPLARTALYNQLINPAPKEAEQEKETWVKAQEEVVQKIEHEDQLTPFECLQAKAMITIHPRFVC